ncbi:hypothetical protein IEQ34_017211 [Dendrobium chrysotoxum]|uniref:Uncharacterized protein n=1 Tax=Dendrobium chrysotoxum TaxID=161865 RepID=A0AAV7GAR3_DENCH|nr:hypothetical protein IEQ34_017211 [Dendrobium chrysotoxum]
MDDGPDQDPMIPSSRTIVVPGFDATKERISSGHNQYLVVPFGGKTTRFREPQINCCIHAGERLLLLHAFIITDYERVAELVSILAFFSHELVISSYELTNANQIPHSFLQCVQLLDNYLFQLILAIIITQVMGDAQSKSVGSKEEEGDKHLQTFYKLKPPLFKGAVGPQAVENWLLRIEKFFNNMQCSES